MKYFLIVCCLCFVAMAVGQTRSVRFEPLEFSRAVVKARNGNKKVFLNAYTPWSKGCRTMAEQVFTNDRVADFCNASFINIELDMEKGEGRVLAEKYGITAYPTFLVFDKDRNEVCRVVGVMDAASFLEKLKAGLNPESSLAAMEKRFREGERSYAFVSEYFAFLHQARMNEKLRAEVEVYFKDMEVKEVCSGSNWNLFDTYVNAVELPQMQRMVAQASTFKALLGKGKAEGKMYAVYGRALSDSLLSAKGMSPAQFKKWGEDIKRMKLGKEQRAGLETLLELAYFKSCGKYGDFLMTFREKGQNLTEIQKQNVVFTLPFMADAPAEFKDQAVGLVGELMEGDRNSEKGLSPQVEQVYQYVLYKLKGSPEEGL